MSRRSYPEASVKNENTSEKSLAMGLFVVAIAGLGL
jgi:hypothetical protein